MAGLALPRGGPIRRFSLFGSREEDDRKHEKIQQLLVERAGMTNGLSWKGTPEQQQRLDEIDAEIAKLDPQAVPGADAEVPSRPAVTPEKKSMLGRAEEWVVDKVKEKVLGEGKPDEDIKKAMANVSTVFEQASDAVELSDKESFERRAAFKELGKKFKEGAETGEKLIKFKEYAELSEEFLKAVEEAKAADPTTVEGTRALFKVMNVGGKLGKKAFPPPLNVEFDFLANPMFMNLVNVKEALDPMSPNTMRGRRLREVMESRD
jgi:hypothetical protein